MRWSTWVSMWLLVAFALSLPLLFGGPAAGSGYKHGGGSPSQVSSDTDVSINTTATIRRDVASPAPSLFMAACTNAVSGQGMGGGAAIGLSDATCKLLMIAQAAAEACHAHPLVTIGGGKCEGDCVARNPRCDDADHAWAAVMHTVPAETGWKGWRATIGQFLPNVVRWLF